MTNTIHTLENINTIAKVIMNVNSRVKRNYAEYLAECWLVGDWHGDDLSKVKEKARNEA